MTLRAFCHFSFFTVLCYFYVCLHMISGWVISVGGIGWEINFLFDGTRKKIMFKLF